MKFNKRKFSQAIALAVSSIGGMGVQAAPLQGGGSTAVQPLIAVEGAGVLTYWGVGSGLGQSAFLTDTAADFTSPFQGKTLTASGTVDFANSDAPLSALQITSYAASTIGQKSGPLIQIPYVTMPITIPLVHAPTGTGPHLPRDTVAQTPTVALDDADLCGIFSGLFTDWSQVTNPDNGSKYPAGAIKVVYPSNGSGMTDLLTAHLAQVCPAPSGAVIKFFETQNFASLFGTSPPSNFIAAKGDDGVAATLLALTGAGISYLSPAYTNTFLAPSSSAAQANNLSVASLRNRFTNADVVPSANNASLAVGTPTAPQTRMLARNQTNWVPVAANPTTGYPISGTSEIIVSQCYADATAASSLVSFLKTHYKSNAAILDGNGFAVVPPHFVTQIGNDFLSNANSFNLDIGNASVCTGTVTGR